MGIKVSEKSTFSFSVVVCWKEFGVFVASDSFLRPFRITRSLEEFYGGAKCVDRRVDVSAYN